MQLLATTREGGFNFTCWFITLWHCRTKYVMWEPCREKEEIKKVCLRANSKLYLHLSSRKKAYFLQTLYPLIKWHWGQLQIQCLQAATQIYCRWQSQQPCHALGRAVTKVFDSLFCFAPYLIMSVEDLGDIAGQRCNELGKIGHLALAGKIDYVRYVCACT